jgi:murein endopeptidase
MTPLLLDTSTIARNTRRAFVVASAVVALSLPCGAAWATAFPTDPDATDAPTLLGSSTPAENPALIEDPAAAPDLAPIDDAATAEEAPQVDDAPPSADAPAVTSAPIPENEDPAPSEVESATPLAGAATTATTPDTDTLQRLVTTDPVALGSLSIGRPDAGALLNPVQMNDAPLWHVRDPRRAWASEETAAFLTAAIEAVERQHPGSPALLISDLSLPRGGSMGRHRSHESGRDADLGWYFIQGQTKDMRRGSARDMDLPRCWSLVRALVTETDVERIFIDRKLQNVLYRYALDKGENQRWLLSLFANVSGDRDAIIEHERGHQTHLHVRFYNRRAQEWGRTSYPFLVEAGLAPRPVINYRPRSGETLSVIARRYGTSVAALRRANGLSSSAIRVGRRYHIPVCKVDPPSSSPLVVPPRRLPPHETATLVDPGK